MSRRSWRIPGIFLLSIVLIDSVVLRLLGEGLKDPPVSLIYFNKPVMRIFYHGRFKA